MELTIDQALQGAVEAHKAGQVQEADRLYTAILKEQPTHPDANHNMGVLAVDVGNVNKALPFFKTALEANPNAAQFWLSYIDALIGLGRLADAKVIFDQAKGNGAKGDGFDSLDHKLKTSTEVLPEADSQEAPQEQLQPLFNLYSQGQLQKVLLEASQLLNKFPNSVSLYNIIGVANKGLGQLSAAIKSYNKALAIRPNNAEAYNNLGNALQTQDNLDEAIEAYTKALTIRHDYAEAHYNMASALQGQGKINEAIEVYKNALTLKPEYVDAHYNLGNALKELGKMGDAIKSYNRAIALKPDFAEAFLNKGDADLDLGKVNEAMEAYNKAIALKPDFAEAYNNKAIVLTEQGKMKDAIEFYKQALTLKPDYTKVSYNLAYLFFITRQYKEAAQLFKKDGSTKSQTYLLKCFYEQGEKSSFYDQLDYLIGQGENNAVIGSYISRSQIRHGTNRLNPFCNEPLKYFLKTDLKKRCDFENVFAKGAISILSDGIVQNRSQRLLTKGTQTVGNVFNQIGDVSDKIQKILRSEIENYRIHFMNSQEGLIEGWPSNYEINGWLVSMKSGGKLAAHMHDEGWISGSVYINVPPKLKKGSGNLVLTSADGKHEKADNRYSKSVKVTSGSLCLFPSSLLHYTIPFEAEENRIVLAFDVIPKY